jgi:phytoene dehydrogenase-like protein
MEDAEVLVVGAGHNGLVCAAYLARAGVDTLLVESRAEVGGLASTVSDLGARFNICSCDHTMIRAMPIIDELGLGDHGLRYLEAEPSSINLFWEGADPWLFFHDAERTVDGIARTRPGQAAAYREYLAAARPVAELAVELASVTPTTPAILRKLLERRGRGARRMLQWSRRSMLEVLRGFFDDDSLIRPAVTTGPSVWGVPPDTPGTGLAATLYAMRHLVHAGRPVGGSGALTDALRATFEAAGGRVRCDTRVEGLLVEDGGVVGARLAGGGELRAGTVVAACDPRRVLVEWLSGPPGGAGSVVRRWREAGAADGYQSKLDGVLHELPRYRALDAVTDQLAGLEPLAATVLVSPPLAEVAEAHRLLRQGRVAERPSMLVNLPSVLDDAMVPEGGGHVLSLETLFTPYALVGGWPGSEEPRRWLDQWATLLDGGLPALGPWRAMTPDRYEREFEMERGYTPSYGGSPLATLLGRRREVSRYETPVEGLFLTGAATYPGAGVWGASGRNAAAIVTRHVEARQR